MKMASGSLAPAPTERGGETLLTSGVVERAVVDTWRAIEPGAQVLRVSTTIGRHSLTVRLEHADCLGVVAKARAAGKLDKEWWIHAELLPHINVPSPRLLGFERGIAGKLDVMFLEDVGDVVYRNSRLDHRRAAGAWLGAFHAATAGLRAPAHIRRRSPDEIPASIAAVAQRIVRVADGSISSGLARLLDHILHSFERAATEAVELGQAVPHLAAGLVHGAFISRNVRIREEDRGITAVPFDWDHAAVSLPAPDLAWSPAPSRGFAPNADIESYRCSARTSGLDIDPETARSLVRLGTIERAVDCIGWATSTLEGRRPERAQHDLSIYVGALDAASMR
jgi:hypothetical protein